MKAQHTPHSLKSLAGSALVAPGLLVLVEHLDSAAAHFSHLLDATAGEGLGLLSSVILAASFGQQQLLHALLSILWPVLPVIVGAALLYPPPEANLQNNQEVLPLCRRRLLQSAARRPHQKTRTHIPSRSQFSAA